MRLKPILTLLLLSTAGGAVAQNLLPVAAEPAAKSFKVGDITATSLLDGESYAPNDGQLFGIGAGADAVAGVLKSAGQPTDRVPLSVNVLLLRMGGENILVDTGLGPVAHGMLMQSLAKADVRPDDISTILITHTHFDHVGGLIREDGSLAFPNATIRISAADWAWLQANPQLAAVVKAITPKVKAFTPGDVVAPGITSVAIAGHTPGHVGYRIVSGGKHLLDIGDTAHSSIVSLAKPDWPMGFDNDRRTAETSRRALLTELSRDHELVFVPHFPFPGVGQVVANGDGFRWRAQK